MRNFTRLTLSALLVICAITTFSFSVEAQQKPIITTSIGGHNSNASISASEAKQLLTMPLVVKDNNNIVYTIESYQFIYKKKTAMLDKNTGKTAYVFTTTSDMFKASPLPSGWVKNISDELQKDEELTFFDIQVKDDKGKKMFAPDIKIRIL